MKDRLKESFDELAILGLFLTILLGTAAASAVIGFVIFLGLRFVTDAGTLSAVIASTLAFIIWAIGLGGMVVAAECGP
jgi:hypothetical protein